MAIDYNMRPHTGRFVGRNGSIVNIADALYSLVGATEGVTITNVDMTDTGESIAMMGTHHRGISLPETPLEDRSKIMIKHISDGETVSLITADSWVGDYPLTDNVDYTFAINPAEGANYTAVATAPTTINVLEQA